jgi:molybdate transport system permease protein
MDWAPFGVSIQLGLWTTALLLVTGFPLAWAFVHAKGAWVVWVESLFSLPLVLAPTVLGFYLLVFLSPNGVVGAFFLKTFGIRLAFSFPGVVIACLVSGLPLMVSTLKTALAQVPPSLLEASYSLGKGRIETLFRVVLPTMRAGLVTGVVLSFAHCLGEFGVVLMVGGSIPGATKVVSIALFERVEALDFASAQAYALVLVLVSYPAVFVLNALQRKSLRRVR